MNRLAAIDLGTNSMRLILSCIEEGKFKSKSKEVLTTRIGKNLAMSKSMSDTMMDKNIEAMSCFKKKAEDFGAEDLIVIATSAVRDASNKEMFLKRVKDELDIEVKVVDGEEEAYIGMLGAAHCEEQDKDLLIFDVGGGSTEIIISRNMDMLYSSSLNVGAVRMTESFISENPIIDSEISNLESHLEEVFNNVICELSRRNIDKVIAIGGTVTSLAAIFHSMQEYQADKIQGSILHYDSIYNIFKELKSMDLAERYKVIGLEKERADIIPVGIYIILYLMRALKREFIYVSDNDSLEGIIIRFSDLF